MASRTALGTWKAKASGTTLQSATQVSLNEGECLIVGAGWQQTSLPTSVAWGAKTIRKSASQVGSLHGCGLWTLRSAAKTDTRYVTITWPSAIGARVMFALKLDAGMIRDDFATSVQTASAAPSVGPTGALDYYDNFAVGLLCSRGPSGDTAPTVSGWTVGQRDGTLGTPPVSNITVAEFYKATAGDKSALTCAGTGATARDWACCLVSWREISVVPPIDANGVEIVVGDTVEYGDGLGTSTASSLSRPGRGPFVKCTLANGMVYNAHALEVVP